MRRAKPASSSVAAMIALATWLAACSGSAPSQPPQTQTQPPQPSPAANAAAATAPAAPPPADNRGIAAATGAAGAALGDVVRNAGGAPTGDASAPPAAAPPPSSPTTPPAPAAPERDDDFVDVTAVIPDAVLDMRYATAHNFTKKQLYPVARCLLRRAVAKRLAAAAEQLRKQERRVVLWDCYRPAAIQQALWDLVPDPSFVARPKFDAAGKPIGGSRHSRGAAVDIALAGADGALLPMPTDHDDFSAAAAAKRALAAEPGGAEAKRLAAAMTAAGFLPIASEWWHFDAPDSNKYGFSDEPLQ